VSALAFLAFLEGRGEGAFYTFSSVFYLE